MKKEITTEDVKDWIAQLEKAALLPTTIRIYVDAYVLGMDDKGFLGMCNDPRVEFYGSTENIKKLEDRYNKLKQSK